MESTPERRHLQQQNLYLVSCILKRRTRAAAVFNAAVELLDRTVEQGEGERIVLRTDEASCTYRQLHRSTASPTCCAAT